MATTDSGHNVKTGLYISGTVHAGIILWLLLGGWFLRPDEAPTLENTQVSLLSAEEFAALSPPEIPPETGVPNEPQEPVTPETPVTPEVPEVEPEEIEAPVAPDPVEAIVDDRPPTLTETPEPLAVPLAPIAPAASPRPSQRVAPQPIVSETPDAVVDTISQEATQSVEEPAPAPEPTPEVEQTTAPEEASDRIVAEAEAPPASAPATSVRPPARPERPEPEPEEPASTPTDDIMAALAEANETPSAQPVQSGPPLSQGEKDALRLSVSECWNVGTLSSEALRTIVVVGLEMGRDGKPEAASLRLISSSGGSQASANQAYEAARRAVLRCGAKGFDLPVEKYDHWKEIEITFDPEKMRNR